MRIFGVGLNKTGTTSLAQACTMLGFRSFHHESKRLDAKDVAAKIDRAISEGRHPFRYVARLRWFDAFFDVRPIENNFEYLDQHFPGSKFILHTRDREAWLSSREKHVERNVRLGRTNWAAVDREGWSRLWERQHNRVAEHFADRPDDLLTIDVAGGDGWDKLCTFLGKPVPSEPFPFANRSGS